LGNRERKEQLVAEIKERITNARSVILADYRGLTVKELTALRARLRAQDVELKVLKNTLVKIAAAQAGVDGLDEYLTGTNMWAFSMTDAVAGAKVLKEFAKTHPKLVLRGGILEKKAFDAAMAETLADLPSREVLLGQVAGLLQSPLVGLVRVLQGPINKLGYALNDYREQQEAKSA
jgi:large subunit ribosomal protein L10